MFEFFLFLLTLVRTPQALVLLLFIWCFGATFAMFDFVLFDDTSAYAAGASIFFVLHGLLEYLFVEASAYAAGSFF